MNQSFEDYRAAVEYHFEEIFLIPFSWFDVENLLIAGAKDDGWTAEQFAVWLGKDREYLAHLPEEVERRRKYGQWLYGPVDQII